MPPKKKGRAPPKEASTPSEDAPEPRSEEISRASNSDTSKKWLTPDPWTDEQETSLFKGMIRWKPVGMHKHFRMIALSEHLRNHGYNGYSSPRNTHTKIPGIWKKLGSLYNLEVLDFREDNFGNPARVNGEEFKEPYCEFALPEDDYGDLKFAKRLAQEGSTSPPSLPHQLSSHPARGRGSIRRHSTVDDTDEPRSSPISARGTPSGRRARGSRGTRTSRLAEVSRPGRRSKASHDQAAEDEETSDGEEEMDGGEEDETEGKAATSRNVGKASKPGTAKETTRRSGRKR